MLRKSYCLRIHCLLTVVMFLAACGGGGGSSIPSFWIENGIAVADLNGDGLSDIVLARTFISGPPPHPGFVDVYLQTDGHSFGTPATHAVGSDPWNLAVGDINNDGRPDIVVANTGSGNISVLLQNASQPGGFLPARHVATGGTPYAVAIRDIDGDGRADLAVAMYGSGGGCAVLLQTPTEPLSFLPSIPLSNGAGATSVAVGDLNHDGRPDIAVNGVTIAVFLQNSTGGTFGPAVQLAAGNRPSSVTIEDVDLDGFKDILASNAGDAFDGSGATISVLRQDPNDAGTFLAAANYPVANGARHLAVAPQKIGPAPYIAVVSLVYSSRQPSVVSTLLNQPPGVFSTGQVLAGPFSGDFIALGDINADGLPDIVVNDGPTVFLQNTLSPGSFAAGVPLP